MLSIDFVLILVRDEGELLLAGYFLLPLAPIAYRALQASAGWLSPRHAMPLSHESCRPTFLISIDWRFTGIVFSVRFMLSISVAGT